MGASWCFRRPWDSVSSRLSPWAGANPFSVLDAKQGVWQRRKKEWHDLFDSSLGRDEDLLGAGLRHLLPASSKLNGTSVFDPVLMENVVSWWVPRPRKVRHRPVVVIDPFAGGVVRGFVAAAKGVQYIGVDVSARQVEANRKQVPQGQWDFRHPPIWVVGDSEQIATLVPKELHRLGLEPLADAIVSCPPYFNLEEYKAGPKDLSGLPSYATFLVKYKRIVANAVSRSAQRPSRRLSWATFVGREVPSSCSTATPSAPSRRRAAACTTTPSSPRPPARPRCEPPGPWGRARSWCRPTKTWSSSSRGRGSRPPTRAPPASDRTLQSLSRRAEVKCACACACTVYASTCRGAAAPALQGGTIVYVVSCEL